MIVSGLRKDALATVRYLQESGGQGEKQSAEKDHNAERRGR